MSCKYLGKLAQLQALYMLTRLTGARVKSIRVRYSSDFSYTPGYFVLNLNRKNDEVPGLSLYADHSQLQSAGS